MDYTEEYYKGRPLEQKHLIETPIWVDYFNPEKVLDVGCGHGMRVIAFNYYEVDCQGFDFLEAIKTTPHLEIKDKLKEGNILNIPYQETFDLVIVYDVLEHLEEEDLDKALSELKRVCSKHILFSIPFIGDPNLLLDKTHKIFKSKEWWNYKLEEYFNIKETPDNFLYKPQLLIGEIR